VPIAGHRVFSFITGTRTDESSSALHL
jgi:hypothetical protein